MSICSCVTFCAHHVLWVTEGKLSGVTACCSLPTTFMLLTFSVSSAILPPIPPSFLFYQLKKKIPILVYLTSPPLLLPVCVTFVFRHLWLWGQTWQMLLGHKRKRHIIYVFFVSPFLSPCSVSHLAAALLPASPTHHICTAQLPTLISSWWANSTLLRTFLCSTLAHESKNTHRLLVQTCSKVSVEKKSGVKMWK